MAIRTAQVLVAVLAMTACAFPVLAKSHNPWGEALVLYRGKQFPAARELFKEALQEKENPEIRAEILIQIAHTFYYEGRFAEAAEKYQEVVDLKDVSDDKKAHAQLYLAACALSGGDPRRAVQEYAKISAYVAANRYYKQAAQHQIDKIKEQL